jgi:hypothetical protein
MPGRLTLPQSAHSGPHLVRIQSRRRGLNRMLISSWRGAAAASAADRWRRDQIGGDLARFFGRASLLLGSAELDGMLAGVEGLPYLLSALGALTAMQSGGVARVERARPVVCSDHPPCWSRYAGERRAAESGEVLRWLDVLQANLRDVRRDRGRASAEISKILRNWNASASNG